MAESFENKNLEILLKKLPDTEGPQQIELLADLTVAFREINPEKVIEFGKQGLELLQDSKEKKLKLVILNEICRAYHYLSKYQTSLEYGFKALELSNASNDDLHKATAINRIGTTYLNMALFNQALECFMQALKIYENIGDKRGIAGLYINIGLVCSKIGDREKALEYYSKAMRTLKEVNDKRSLAILYNPILMYNPAMPRLSPMFSYILRACIIILVAFTMIQRNIKRLWSILGKHLKSRKKSVRSLE